MEPSIQLGLEWTYCQWKNLSKEWSFIITCQFLQNRIQHGEKFLNQCFRHITEKFLQIFINTCVILMQISTVQCTQFQRLNIENEQRSSALPIESYLNFAIEDNIDHHATFRGKKIISSGSTDQTTFFHPCFEMTPNSANKSACSFEWIEQSDSAHLFAQASIISEAICFKRFSRCSPKISSGWMIETNIFVQTNQDQIDLTQCRSRIKHCKASSFHRISSLVVHPRLEQRGESMKTQSNSFLRFRFPIFFLKTFVNRLSNARFH